MKYISKILVSSVVLSTLCFSMAHANDTNSTEQSSNDQWKFSTNIYAFAADMDGTVGYRNVNYALEQSFSDTVKQLNKVMMANFDLNHGKWGAFADIQYVKTRETENILYFPVEIESTVSLSNMGLYYKAFDQNVWGGNLVIEPLAGVEYTHIKTKLGSLGHTVDTEKNWFEYIGGARLRYNANSPWNFAAQYTYGLEKTEIAQAYIGYRIPNRIVAMNLRAGYRYVHQDYTNDNFKWDVTQKGPVIGVGFSF